VTSRRLLVITAAVGLLLVLAAGASRVSYSVGGVERSCPERVWSSALDGLSTPRGEPVDACAAASRDRLFTVAIALMGLVLVSGLLARTRD
jgi:hypothetical protein